MKKTVLLACTSLLALIVVGCSGGGGSSSPTGTEEVMDGTFELRQIRATGGGSDVTFAPPAATGAVVVTSDGRFTATLDMPVGGVSGTWTGTYTVAGNVLTLRYDGGGVEEWAINDERTTVAGTFTENGVNVSPTYVLV